MLKRQIEPVKMVPLKLAPTERKLFIGMPRIAPLGVVQSGIATFLEASHVDVTQLPFNRLVGLLPAGADSGFLVTLPEGPQYTNHLGTVHASALLAVAEAGSGAFLVEQLGDSNSVLPVVRRLEAKFRRPATGCVSARAIAAPECVARWTSELSVRGRVSAEVQVEVVDAAGTVVLSATVEWFISKGQPRPNQEGTER